MDGKYKCRRCADAPLFSRPAPGFAGVYAVTFDGRVYSHGRVDARGHQRRGKWLKPILANNGYLRIHACVKAERRKVMIHRLVAGAFVDQPDGTTGINHIDGIKTNNTMANLEWVTPSENFKHALANHLVVNIRNPLNGQFVRHIS